MLYTIIYRDNITGDECADKFYCETPKDAERIAAERIRESETAYICFKNGELYKAINYYQVNS